MHSPKRRWMDTVLISMMVFYLMSLVNQLNLRCQQLDILYPAVLKGRQLIHRVSSPGKTMLWLKQGISSYTKRTISYNIYLTKLMVGMNQIHLSPKSNGISITNSIIGCRSYYIPIFLVQSQQLMLTVSYVALFLGQIHTVTTPQLFLLVIIPTNTTRLYIYSVCVCDLFYILYIHIYILYIYIYICMYIYILCIISIHKP
jgi:hypothetical protein